MRYALLKGVKRKGCYYASFAMTTSAVVMMELQAIRLIDTKVILDPW